MRKILLTIIGTISLGLGIVGIILPVLPTIPFLLLSLYCYLRSSRKLYNYVLNNKYLAPYVKDYISGNGIPMNAKKKAIFLIWLTIGFSIGKFAFLIDSQDISLTKLTKRSICYLFLLVPLYTKALGSIL